MSLKVQTNEMIKMDRTRPGNYMPVNVKPIQMGVAPLEKRILLVWIHFKPKWYLMRDERS